MSDIFSYYEYENEKCKHCKSGFSTMFQMLDFLKNHKPKKDITHIDFYCWFDILLTYDIKTGEFSNENNKNLYMIEISILKGGLYEIFGK